MPFLSPSRASVLISALVLGFLALFFALQGCTHITIEPPETPRNQRTSSQASSQPGGDASPTRRTEEEGQHRGEEGREIPHFEEFRPTYVEYINQARSEGRLCGENQFDRTTPLHWDQALAAAARDHALDLAVHRQNSHTGSDGSSVRNRIERYSQRFGAVAENIALGTREPRQAMFLLLRSPGHCRNIMGPQYSHVGIAYTENENGYPYTVMVFGNRH